jgi:nucleoside-diphosphate-sugar epimerase
MASVLVAGAAGLIGSALCRQLLAQGQSVIGLDNFLTGSRENSAELQAFPGFRLIEADITLPWPEALQAEAFSQIYHLASPASPLDFETLPLEILKVNSLGTWNLLDLARKHQAKLVYTSTSEVYGNPQVHPQVESYWGHVNPVGQRSCYDEGKRFGEALIVNYARVHGLRYSIARVFNTYGPGMANDGRVVPQFLLQALRKEPLSLHGAGQQTRSFCFVSDLVRGLAGLMHSEQTDGEIYNLGNPQEYTIETLATTICEVAGIPTRLQALPSPRSDDPERRRPDISKIRAAIGWEPQVSLREGLELSLADFRRRFA